MKISPLPIILIGAVAAFAFSGKVKASPSLPFSITCESITIKDPTKTDIWFTQQAREYADKLPDLESLSYTTLVGNILQKTNKACYDKFIAQTFTKNSQMLAAIIRDKAQKGFITAYFGDPAVLQGDDKINYDQFATVIHPERLEEFSKNIGWNVELDKEFENVLKTVNADQKWPL